MTKRIEESANLFDYFHLRVADARASRDLPLSDQSVLYLAQLMVDRARADRPTPPADTLAELHAAAASQSRPADQARTWRELGDRALHSLGTERDRLEARSVVPLSYYEAMGRQGYRRLDEVMKRSFADAFGGLFTELAARFDAAVSALNRACEAAHRGDELDQLLEEWIATGSEEVARRLRLRGVVVARRAVEG